MKRFSLALCCVFCTLLLLSSLGSKAQNISTPPPQPINLSASGLRIDSIINYLKVGLSATDTGEGSTAAQVANFARIWKDRVSYNDSSGANMFQKYLYESQKASMASTSTCGPNADFYSGKWTSIGPDSFPTQNLGMVIDVWAAPNDTNLLLTAGYGGVWKSIDGGKHWNVISDNSPVSKGIVSCAGLAVDPLDNQHFYVGSRTYAILHKG